MRRIALLLIMVVTLGGCFTPGVLNPFPPDTTPTDQRVVLFGDSLSWDASSEVIALYQANPDVALSHNSFGATTVDNWMDEIGQVPAGSTVVMGLGTNDVALLKDNLDQWKMIEALNILQGNGVNCIVWLTLSTDTADRFGGQRRTDTYEYNAALRSIDSYNNSYPNFYLQDWDALSEGHDEYFNFPTDWLHHTQAGQDAYAAAQYDAIHRCGGN